MPELTPVLYKSLGLPCPGAGKKLPADHNGLTKKADRDGDGKVDTAELYEMVFADRAAFRPVIKKLHEAGLEDPFEERPEIEAYVQGLFEKHRPRGEKQKAILLFRAVIPEGAEFIASDYYRSFIGGSARVYGPKNIYHGLSARDGGLEIRYDDDFGAAFRKKFGDLLPRELIGLPAEGRFALCKEYSQLLVVFLRAAGINAGIKGVPGHSYVVAKLEGRNYCLDAASLAFHRTRERPDSDLKGILSHYSNERAVFFAQDLEEQAFRAWKMIVELVPGKASFWNSMGRELAERGRLRDAYKAFRRALAIEPEYALAWNNVGVLLMAVGKRKDALYAFRRALEIEPRNPGIIRNHKRALTLLAAL